MSAVDCLESVGADCAVISSRIYFEIQWKFDDLYAVFLLRMSIPQNQNLCCGARVVQVPPGTADGLRIFCTRRYKNSYVAWEVLE